VNFQWCKAKILAVTVAAAGRAWENKDGHGTLGMQPQRVKIPENTK